MVHRPALVSVKEERVNVSQVWNLNEVNPLAHTLGAAAKASGKSKATISKAIKSGRLSALKDETGVYQPSELSGVRSGAGLAARPTTRGDAGEGKPSPEGLLEVRHLWKRTLDEDAANLTQTAAAPEDLWGCEPAVFIPRLTHTPSGT